MLGLVLGSAGVGLGVGYGLAMKKMWRWIIGLAFLLAGIFVYCYVAPKDGTGYNGIGYAIVAVLLVMPAAGGLGLGTLIGSLRLRARR